MSEYQHSNRLVILLGFLTAFPSISTDLYLPSLPHLQKLWNESMSAVNLTLVAFFSAFCISILIYGPLSDQFGRKKPLLAGMGIYIAASISCSLSSDISQLIISRIFQAIGAASAAGLSIAICRDVFKGSERARILSLINAFMAFSPMTAPFISSLILRFLSWHWIFLIQAMLGTAGWIGVYLMRETKESVSTQKAIETAGAYIELLQNRIFVFITILFSMIFISYFAYIGSSSNIFIRIYGCSEEIFSLFFALNAVALMAGSFISSRLIKIVNSKHLITAALVCLSVSGAVMTTELFSGPWRVAFPMFFCTLSFAVIRPTAISLSLGHVRRYAGAASSFIMFTQFLTAAISMRLIALGWKDTVTALGSFAVISSITVLFVWLSGAAKLAVKPNQLENK